MRIRKARSVIRPGLCVLTRWLPKEKGAKGIVSGKKVPVQRVGSTRRYGDNARVDMASTWKRTHRIQMPDVSVHGDTFHIPA